MSAAQTRAIATLAETTATRLHSDSHTGTNDSSTGKNDNCQAEKTAAPAKVAATGTSDSNSDKSDS